MGEDAGVALRAVRHTELRLLSETDDAEGGERLAFGGLNTMLYVWVSGREIVAFRFSFLWQGSDICVTWDRERPDHLDWDVATVGEVPRGTPFLEPLRQRPAVSVEDLFAQLSRLVPARIRQFVLDHLKSLA